MHTRSHTTSRGQPPGWEAVLPALRADALDCLQTTLALVGDGMHGAGTHHLLGCRPRLEAGVHGGLVSVRRSLADRLNAAAELLGLRPTAPRSGVDGPTARRLAARGGPLYVVADAHAMAWTPYAGREHMEHSFLLEADGDGGYTVVDAYHNDTTWGPARPGSWPLDAAAVDRTLSGGACVFHLRAATRTPAVDVHSVLAANAAAARSTSDIDAYTAAVREQLGRPGAAHHLVLDIWLLGRERLLHSVWLEGLREVPAAAAAEANGLAEAWSDLTAHSYLALRRTQRGAPMNPTVVDDLERQLHLDAAFTVRLGAQAAQPVRDAQALRAAVLTSVCTVLGVSAAAAEAAGRLRDLPGFDSFRLVAILDRIEADLGLAPVEEISAKDLRDVDSLCRLFTAERAPATGEERTDAAASA